MNKDNINKIEVLAIKIAEILQEENPYTKVIIADNQIRITQDVITIQVKKETAQEVPVQEQLKKRKILLIQSLGKENFESIVDEVNKIIKEYNLNTTPTILIDLLNYICTVTLL